MVSDAENARVESRQLPIFPRDGRTVCAELHLSPREARRLFADGWLSFDPDQETSLDESREAELAFLGALAAAKCTRTVLARLLEGLRKPYCYDIRRVFFDWAQQQWRLLPGEDDPEGAFFALMERLRDRQAREVLANLHDWLEEALDLERDRSTMFAHGGNGFNARPRRDED